MPRFFFHLCLYRLRENIPSWLSPHDHAVIDSCINSNMSCIEVESLCPLSSYQVTKLFILPRKEGPQGLQRRCMWDWTKTSLRIHIAAYYGYLSISRVHYTNATRWSCEDHVIAHLEVLCPLTAVFLRSLLLMTRASVTVLSHTETKHFPAFQIETVFLWQ